MTAVIRYRRGYCWWGKHCWHWESVPKPGCLHTEARTAIRGVCCKCGKVVKS